MLPPLAWSCGPFFPPGRSVGTAARPGAHEAALRLADVLVAGP
jgi:hypothetical protein